MGGFRDFRRSAQTIRIFSVEVSPDSASPDNRKSICLHRLHVLVKEANKMGSKLLKWSGIAQKAFDEIKYRVENSVMLYYVREEGTMCVQPDSCNHGAGTVLFQQQQMENGQWIYRIIDMYYKQFPTHMIALHIGPKEALAIFWGVNHFEYYLMTRMFIINTDHRNLERILNQSKNH